MRVHASPVTLNIASGPPPAVDNPHDWSESRDGGRPTFTCSGCGAIIDRLDCPTREESVAAGLFRRVLREAVAKGLGERSVSFSSDCLEQRLIVAGEVMGS
jgi:hypothetical protein